MKLRNLFRAGPGAREAARFYGEILGLPLVPRGRGAEVDCGGLVLRLHEELTPEEAREWGLPSASEVLAFEVEDLEALHRRFLEEGITLRVPPRESPWGGRIMLAEDPAGHLLEFVEP